MLNWCCCSDGGIVVLVRLWDSGISKMVGWWDGGVVGWWGGGMVGWWDGGIVVLVRWWSDVEGGEERNGGKKTQYVVLVGRKCVDSGSSASKNYQ